MKGQTLVEVFFLVPVLVILISALFFFARVLITRQQLVMAARYGTDMILYTQLNQQQIKQEIRNYLSDPHLSGRKLDPDKLTDNDMVIVDHSQDFQIPDFTIMSIFTNPNQALSKLRGIISGIGVPFNNTSYVEIYYKFDVPGIFNAMGSYLPGPAKMPSVITVSGRSEVLAGTGCKGANHKRHA